MTDFAVDIVVPIWNNPVETRSCLVNLAEHSPQARIILVDNGSERETERLLEEFAEILDQRALLVRTDLNLGFVRAANRGLARGESDCLALVKSCSQVSAGWLEPLLATIRERGDAGLVVPHITARTLKRGVESGKSGTAPHEVDHAEFAAMLLRRDLYRRIGGLDDEMDAGLWCLKDFSRRALRAGFTTVAAWGGLVSCREETIFGSEVRRHEALLRSRELYRERWGEERAFCLHIPKGIEAVEVNSHRETLLRGARQGHTVTVFLPARLHRELEAEHCPGHENIRWRPVPRLLSERWLHREVSRVRDAQPGIVCVRWEEAGVFPLGAESIGLTEMTRIIDDISVCHYGG